MLQVLILLSLIFCTYSQDTQVREYNDDDFKDIRNFDISIGLFYSPDCSYCQKFLPHFMNAMKEMENSDPKIHFFNVNCLDNGKLTCEREDIPSYPYIKVYIDGKFADQYEGDRRTDELVKYLKENFGYSSKELINSNEVDKILNSLDYAVLGYFERYTGLQTAFLKASFVLRDKAKFGHITSGSLLKKYGFKNSVILYIPKHFHNKFEAPHISYIGHGDAQELIKFIEDNYHGLVGQRTQNTQKDFKPPLVITYYDIDYKNSPRLTNYWRNRILLVAHRYENITFAISDKYEFENELWKLGLNSSSFETPLVLALHEKEIFYLMEANFSVDALHNFVQDFSTGSLKPYVKSEPLPEENDDPVKILVAKNFYEIMNNEKDVFVQFYTPWCMICLEFATVYEDLALEIGDDVVIAKMNVAANDYPSFISIKSYPAFYLARKGMFNNPLLYNGTLSLQEMIKFIAEHATVELRRFDREGNLRSRTEL